MTVALAMEVGEESPTGLYRLYSKADGLLYVGITHSLKARFAAHAATKEWWPDVTRKTVEWYMSREEAEAAELEAIRAENPRHNIAGRKSSPSGFDPGDLPDTVRTEDVLALVKLQMTPTALRLALLELMGIPTGAALDMLGVDRTSRYRVINQRCAALKVPAGQGGLGRV